MSHSQQNYTTPSWFSSLFGKSAKSLHTFLATLPENLKAEETTGKFARMVVEELSKDERGDYKHV